MDDPTLPPLGALLREVLYKERPVDDPTLPVLSSKPLKSSLLDLSASSFKNMSNVSSGCNPALDFGVCKPEFKPRLPLPPLLRIFYIKNLKLHQIK